MRVITLPVRDSRDKPHPRSVGRSRGRSVADRAVGRRSRGRSRVFGPFVAHRAVGRAYSVDSSPIARSVARPSAVVRASSDDVARAHASTRLMGVSASTTARERAEDGTNASTTRRTSAARIRVRDADARALLQRSSIARRWMD